MKICICEKHNIPFLMYTVKSKYINGDDFHDYSLLEFCVSDVNNDFISYKLFRVSEGGGRSSTDLGNQARSLPQPTYLDHRDGRVSIFRAILACIFFI